MEKNNFKVWQIPVFKYPNTPSGSLGFLRLLAVRYIYRYPATYQWTDVLMYSREHWLQGEADDCSQVPPPHPQDVLFKTVSFQPHTFPRDLSVNRCMHAQQRTRTSRRDRQMFSSTPHPTTPSGCLIQNLLTFSHKHFPETYLWTNWCIHAQHKALTSRRDRWRPWSRNPLRVCEGRVTWSPCRRHPAVSVWLWWACLQRCPGETTATACEPATHCTHGHAAGRMEISS